MQAAKEHFEAGRLAEAIQAMNGEVKANPGDANRRSFLGELLCLAGNLERADLQFDVIGQQAPKLAIGVALSRQLIRGEQARRQFFAEGRLPEMFGVPPEHLRLALEASVRLREGAAEEGEALLARAEAARPPLQGTCDGRPFDDFRDLDDVVAGAFEIVTSTGKYYLVPIERVAYVEFKPLERPRDLMWRRAEMAAIDGPEGEVFMPVAYVAPPSAAIDDAARLGRKTDWLGGEGAPARGVGQRCFLVGENDLGILELGRLDFAAPRG